MPFTTEATSIRQATEEDLPFIEQMCFLAAFPQKSGDSPTFEEARQLSWFQEYTRNWPNHIGDFGLIAENGSGEPVGAAWYRDYPRKELEASIPTHELSIAVTSEARGKQVGKQLLLGLMDGAAQEGVKELVLQVEDSNERAKELYRKVGFVTVTRSGENYDVMVAPTSADTAK